MCVRVCVCVCVCVCVQDPAEKPAADVPGDVGGAPGGSGLPGPVRRRVPDPGCCRQDHRQRLPDRRGQRKTSHAVTPLQAEGGAPLRAEGGTPYGPRVAPLYGPRVAHPTGVVVVTNIYLMLVSHVGRSTFDLHMQGLGSGVLAL